ncbi:MAG: hypothetical protein Q4B85_07040 [Lachnospiraceae bacterium]|nr:hypothetical protein [Lachnospiraceae bacterium]
MLASAGIKAPADELPKAAMVHEQVAKRIANVRFTHCWQWFMSSWQSGSSRYAVAGELLLMKKE